MSILHKIQKELKAPKNQYNSFGKYKYRSCEDIVEAVKPLLPDGVSLVLSDKMVGVGGRVYVQATARLIKGDVDNLISIAEADGWAREPESKKGMDESQITGAASSYARKYALNGLFAIDDTKDADATNKHGKDNLLDSDARNDANVTWLDTIYKKIDKAKSLDALSACLTDADKKYWEGKLQKDFPIEFKALNKRYKERQEELTFTG